MVMLSFELSHYKDILVCFEQLRFPSESPVELCVLHITERSHMIIDGAIITQSI